MELWLCCLAGVLFIIILILVCKICILRKAAMEISDAFSDRLGHDTNTLIDICSRDRAMRALAGKINVQLQKLREERLRCQMGDREIKDAVTNISHDLRTPLTAICGYLDLLEKEEKSGNVSRYLKIIRSRTDVLCQLSEELFRYSVVTADIGEMPTEPIVLNRILEDSISASYALLKERNITPAISIPEAEVRRTLSRSACTRIFGNLVSNAVKYSDGDLNITLEENGRITFSNHASGLDEILTGRLFDRYYTVETASPGSTGLGLSIARTLTEQMGGSIEADYRNGMLYIRLFFP